MFSSLQWGGPDPPQPAGFQRAGLLPLSRAPGGTGCPGSSGGPRGWLAGGRRCLAGSVAMPACPLVALLPNVPPAARGAGIGNGFPELLRSWGEREAHLLQIPFLPKGLRPPHVRTVHCVWHPAELPPPPPPPPPPPEELQFLWPERGLGGLEHQGDPLQQQGKGVTLQPGRPLLSLPAFIEVWDKWDAPAAETCCHPLPGGVTGEPQSSCTQGKGHHPTGRLRVNLLKRNNYPPRAKWRTKRRSVHSRGRGLSFPGLPVLWDLGAGWTSLPCRPGGRKAPHLQMGFPSPPHWGSPSTPAPKTSAFPPWIPGEAPPQVLTQPQPRMDGLGMRGWKAGLGRALGVLVVPVVPESAVPWQPGGPTLSWGHQGGIVPLCSALGRPHLNIGAVWGDTMEGRD
ncbi:uncharacterized protein LOC127463170 [Manacus candei]|uniref:uncharacterized protein LOC127463170 n=1 Tax=Manacus candei TaxID=415023 RepID=UPI002226BB33|nr:uncharacterized protein LOC127463170 [Manacus candei]XP_051628233.1 uncharacterized protein LOC127463170 [Manacus candei]